MNQKKLNRLEPLLFKLVGNGTSFKSSNFDHIQGLLELSVNPNACDKDGKTPLHYLAYDYYAGVDVIKCFLQHNANINVKDKRGRTPLYYAICQASYGNAPVDSIEKKIKLLINCGASIHDTDTLKLANFYCSQEAIKLLTDKKAINIESEDQSTLLHLAAKNDYYTLAKCLVAKGNNINIKNENGFTPLHLAVENGYYSLAKYLVRHGADINAKDNSGKTPLDYVKRKINMSTSSEDCGVFITITLLCLCMLPFVHPFLCPLFFVAAFVSCIAPCIGPSLINNLDECRVNVNKEKIKNPDINTWTALTMFYNIHISNYVNYFVNISGKNYFCYD